MFEIGIDETISYFKSVLFPNILKNQKISL